MTTTTHPASTVLQGSMHETVDENDHKFLTFRLGDEEYGAEILRVREIIGVIDITPLPQTPDYVKGVINLRGKIIPVIELRTKFGMPPVPCSDETCIIVVEVTDPNTDDNLQMGLIVDTVREVMDIAQENIEPAPEFGCAVDTNAVLGMGKVRERVIILLDIGKVITSEDLSSVQARSSEAALDMSLPTTGG